MGLYVSSLSVFCWYCKFAIVIPCLAPVQMTFMVVFLLTEMPPLKCDYLRFVLTAEPCNSSVQIRIFLRDLMDAAVS